MSAYHITSEELRRAQFLLPVQYVGDVVNRSPQLDTHWTGDQHVGGDGLDTADVQYVVFDQKYSVA